MINLNYLKTRIPEADLSLQLKEPLLLLGEDDIAIFGDKLLFELSWVSGMKCEYQKHLNIKLEDIASNRYKNIFLAEFDTMYNFLPGLVSSHGKKSEIIGLCGSAFSLPYKDFQLDVQRCKDNNMNRKETDVFLNLKGYSYDTISMSQSNFRINEKNLKVKELDAVSDICDFIKT